jgi:AraC-like DNA-binding protein
MVAELVDSGLLPRQPQPAPGPDDSKHFDELLRYVDEGGRWGHRKAANCLERILIALAEARHARATADIWLPHLLGRLGETGGRPDEYAVLAREQGVSLSTLRRRFRKAMGIPLHDYVLRMRAARARNLLAETDLPLKAIADKLGYSDVFFFSRQFKKFVGVNPGVYRQSCQRGA